MKKSKILYAIRRGIVYYRKNPPKTVVHDPHHFFGTKDKFTQRNYWNGFYPTLWRTRAGVEKEFKRLVPIIGSDISRCGIVEWDRRKKKEKRVIKSCHYVAIDTKRRIAFDEFRDGFIEGCYPKEKKFRFEASMCRDCSEKYKIPIKRLISDDEGGFCSIRTVRGCCDLPANFRYLFNGIKLLEYRDEQTKELEYEYNSLQNPGGFRKFLAYSRKSLAYSMNGLPYKNKSEYYEKCQHDRPIFDYSKSLEINPTDAEAYTIRGLAYSEVGQHYQAISDFTMALELKPGDAGTYNNRGTAYVNKGQFGQAISDYTMTLKINPDHAAAYYNRGTAYGKKGKYDEAISDFSKALEINPRDGKSYYNRGVAYYFKREYGKSWKDVEKAQRLGYEAPPEFLNELHKASKKKRKEQKASYQCMEK